MKEKPVHHHIREYDLALRVLSNVGLHNSQEGRAILKRLKTPADRARAKADKPVVEKKSDAFEVVQDACLEAMSEYIRTRDTREVSHGLRRGICCTCKTLNDYSKLSCGHWISRKEWGTKFHPFNNHAQCWGCNSKMMGNGRMADHEEYIIQRHGAEWPDKLRFIARTKARKLTIEELEKKTEEFKNLTAAVLARQAQQPKF